MLQNLYFKVKIIRVKLVNLKIFIFACFRFARKTSQGLKFLQERHLIGNKPEDIAAFFHNEDRLDKTVVGDYLGDGDE